MMNSPHRSTDRHWLSVWNLVLLSLALWCLTSHVECRWCTRIESFQTIRTVVQPSKCNQSYEESCGWFTNDQCTRYELVDCLIQKNHTVLRYRMVTDCCQGFRLDPINNMTCIVDPEATTVTTGIENVSATHRSVVTVEPQSQSKEDASIKELTQHEKDESIFLNLSSGAYTGIICAFVFLLCVFILIGLHFLKNQRRLKAKATQESFELDARQKMISFPPRA